MLPKQNKEALVPCPIRTAAPRITFEENRDSRAHHSRHLGTIKKQNHVHGREQLSRLCRGCYNICLMFAHSSSSWPHAEHNKCL